MFLWSKGLLITTSLLSSFSNFTPEAFTGFFNDQMSLLSWEAKGALAIGAIVVVHQWYQMRSLKKKIDRIKYENMYFKDMLSLILFGIEDYPLIRRSYWQNDHAIQASRLRIRNVFADLRRYDLEEDELIFREIARTNAEFLNHEIESK